MTNYSYRVIDNKKYVSEADYLKMVAERDILAQVAYCAEGMFDCEINSNAGDAKDWKRQLKLATDEYYESIHSSREAKLERSDV